MEAGTSKTTTCTRLILTGVGTGPIIRGPWHRACLTESIARTWLTMQWCWSASIRSAKCLACRIYWRTRRDPCGRVSHLRNSARAARAPPSRSRRIRNWYASVACKASRLPRPAAARLNFRTAWAADAADSQREVYAMDEGRVSLRELAEEELLLALPIVAACDTPQTCGRAPVHEAGAVVQDLPSGRSRPFSALQDLLKKT